MLAEPITELGPVLAAKRVLSNHPDAEALSENQPTGSAFLSNSPIAIYFSITAREPEKNVAVVAEQRMLCSMQVPL